MLTFSSITLFYCINLSQHILHFIIACILKLSYFPSHHQPPTKFLMVGVTTWIAPLLFHYLFCWQGRGGKKKPPNSLVPVVLMTSVLFMFCTEPWWMIKCVWDTAVGNTLSVTVGNVPELLCHQFFTISFLEGGIQSLTLFPSSPMSPLQWINVRSLPEMKGWAVTPTASPRAGAGRSQEHPLG